MNRLLALALVFLAAFHEAIAYDAAATAPRGDALKVLVYSDTAFHAAVPSGWLV